MAILCLCQLGNLLRFVIGLKASVAGISIIALGTSLPDTFTSRTTALHDEYADTAFGNVTGQLAVLTSSLLILFQGSKLTLLPSLFS
jgi:Ca2+/Na+ antiporter